MSSDDGRTVLESVIALSIVAMTALGWSQVVTVAANTETFGNVREDAMELATSEIELLAATPAVEQGTDGAGGLASFDGLAILTDESGPDHTETRDVGAQSFDITRFVLDPGSTTWRRLVVTVGWGSGADRHEVRVDTAIPVLPDAVITGQELLVNGSFEMASGGPSRWGIVDVEGWRSDRGDGRLEIWRSGFQSVVASDGDFLSELNISRGRTVSQTVEVEIGVTYQWTIDHRGRRNDDTLAVVIDGDVVATHTTPRGAWVTYSGTYTAADTSLTIGFRGVDSGGVGNLVDNASLVAIGG